MHGQSLWTALVSKQWSNQVQQTMPRIAQPRRRSESKAATQKLDSPKAATPGGRVNTRSFRSVSYSATRAACGCGGGGSRYLWYPATRRSIRSAVPGCRAQGRASHPGPTEDSQRNVTGCVGSQRDSGEEGSSVVATADCPRVSSWLALGLMIRLLSPQSRETYRDFKGGLRPPCCSSWGRGASRTTFSASSGIGLLAQVDGGSAIPLGLETPACGSCRALMSVQGVVILCRSNKPDVRSSYA